jgi:hypothetical protein
MANNLLIKRQELSDISAELLAIVEASYSVGIDQEDIVDIVSGFLEEKFNVVSY